MENIEYDKDKFDSLEDYLNFNECYMIGGGFDWEYGYSQLMEFLSKSGYPKKYKDKFLDLHSEFGEEKYNNFYKNYYKKMKEETNLNSS